MQRRTRDRGGRHAARLAALSIAVLLAACGRSDRPATPDRAGRTPVAGPSERETARCHADLRAMGVAFEPLPDRQFGPGCGLVGTVKLLDVGVPTANLGAIRCGQARTYAAWARNAVAPAAYQMLGSELRRVVSMGSYACRNVVGSARAGNRRSGHAIANAIDIAAFELKDGRRISIAADWNSGDAEVRRFLRTIHGSACRRFGTVLSPDYNAAHRDHLHLEDDGARFCR